MDDTNEKAVRTAIQTSLGAQRTLRNYIRRALHTRLARAYISRESSVGYSHSGAPGHLDLEKDLMERAWPKEDVGMSGWDAGRFGRDLAGSVEAWNDFSLGENYPWVSHAKDKVLEEAAGTLKDILQELDSREDDTIGLEDVEANAIGETLFNLARSILPLK